MTQRFANFFGLTDENLRAQVQRELRSQGFDSNDRRGGGRLSVRVREGTPDADQAESIVRGVVPSATRGPDSTPTANVADYREGR